MNWMVRTLITCLLLSGVALFAAPVSEEERLYEEALELRDKRDWAEAAALFERVAALDGRKADAALYWRAWSQHKAKRHDSMVRTIELLIHRYPQSSWRDEAESLLVQADIKRRDGKLQSEYDEAIKLESLAYLMRTEPDKAADRLETFLGDDYSSDAKQRALFLLMQSGSNDALAIVTDLALESGSRDLREAAIHQLGIAGGEASLDALAEVFDKSRDERTKEHVLHSYMIMGEASRVRDVARDARSEALREAAIHNLGVMNEVEALHEIYEKAVELSVREAVLNGYMVAGEAQRIYEIAKQEESERLRGTAVNMLGALGESEALWELYQANPEGEIAESLIHGFMVSGDAERLFKIAETTASTETRASVMRMLGVMGEVDALENMLESETNEAVLASIIEGLFISGESGPLLDLVESERYSQQLRRQALRSYGMMGERDSKERLMKLYRDLDPSMRSALLEGLLDDDHVDLLIEIARSEKDPQLRAAAVRQLAVIGSPRARDFMLELLDEN